MPVQTSLPRYPWDQWFRRKRFRLKRGEDFNCMPHSMMIQIRTAAAKRRIQVRVEIDDDTLTVRRK